MPTHHFKTFGLLIILLEIKILTIISDLYSLISSPLERD